MIDYLARDAAAPCSGEVYADDGHSFAYRQGAYARIKFRCEAGQGGSVTLTIAPQQGSFKPWWSEYKLEVYGLAPVQHTAMAGRDRRPLEADGKAWTVVVPAVAAGETVLLL